MITLSRTFAEIPLRLQGPLSANGTGRVEIFYRGQWGAICNNSWSIYEARIVCRQLGYRFTIRALGESEVPSDFGQIWLDGVYCHGYEQNLTECRHNGWGNHSCNHSQVAGVECSDTGGSQCAFSLSRENSN